jgi:hypothetical protein
MTAKNWILAVLAAITIAVFAWSAVHVPIRPATHGIENQSTGAREYRLVGS